MANTYTHQMPHPKLWVALAQMNGARSSNTAPPPTKGPQAALRHLIESLRQAFHDKLCMLYNDHKVSICKTRKRHRLRHPENKVWRPVCHIAIVGTRDIGAIIAQNQTTRVARFLRGCRCMFQGQAVVATGTCMFLACAHCMERQNCQCMHTSLHTTAWHLYRPGLLYLLSQRMERGWKSGLRFRPS